MSHKYDSRIAKLFKTLQKEYGFKIEHLKSGSIRLSPPSNVDGPKYITHGTESCFHPLRRDFKRIYKIDI